MEVKKNPRYDLEKKRSLFLQIGFFLSLALVLAAFEYKTPVKEAEDLVTDILDVDVEEMVPITKQDEPKPIQPPEVKPIEITNILLAEDDDEDITDLDIIDSDVSEDESVEIKAISEDAEEDDEDIPFVKVENMPIFNPKKNRTYDEGLKDLFITMQKKARYPVVAQENGIQGRVFVKFVVTKTGEISNIKVMRSVDPELDKEAIRVVRSLPKFKPGTQRNRPVSVWFSGYISFVLQ